MNQRWIRPGSSTSASETDLTRPATDASSLAQADAPASLVLQQGELAGTSFPLSATCTTVGRQHDCDIVIEDATVSRRHATVHQHGDRFTVTDLGSFNGTYVNWNLVDSAELTDGDEVWIGTVCFLFHTR